MTYDVDYFIRKFKAIPPKLWITGSFGFNGSSARCAAGHCGVDVKETTKEVEALAKILKPLKRTLTIAKYYSEYPFWDIVTPINDKHVKEYQQGTPKKRILAALYDIKKMQDGQATSPAEPIKTVIKYVAVPISLNEETKKLVLS